MLVQVQELTGALLSLANECIKEVGASEIPQALSSEAQNSMPEWTNPYLLTALCLNTLLSKEHCLQARIHPGAGFHVFMTPGNQAIAKATDAEKLKHWSELGFEKIRRRWVGGKFSERIAKLLADAQATSRSAERLLFTHGLGVDCDLVSGTKRRRHS